jgi:4-aminobutyrate aminotransferase-like enzyme
MVTRPTTRLLKTSLTSGEAAVPYVTGGEGVWFQLAGGGGVTAATNPPPPLGHGHPEIVEAVRRAASAPVVNEGWGWEERDEAANDLVQTAFGSESWVGAVRFFISASEANDAALSLAQAVTGRSDLATRERAYHGSVGLARELTIQPQWHGGLAGPSRSRVPPRLATVHKIPAPTSSRVTGQPDPTAGDDWIDDARAKLRRSAAVLLDYSQGGTYHSPGYQDRIAEMCRDAGALWIADETVTGFGRIGGWFQFQHADSRPHMVTMGKCLAAGGAAAGAIVLSKTLLDQIEGTSWQSYSTFRGHPVEVAAIRAHLRVSARDRIFERAIGLDALMLSHMEEVANAHPGVKRIDGRGLHWTVELQGPDWRTWRGEESEPLASRVASRALEADVLIATSGEQTSLFIAPPLIVSEPELEKIFDALHHGLDLADRDYATTREA